VLAATTHDVSLIATIAVSLAFAFVGGLLRLPPLVAYLLAGIVVRVFTPGFVADAHLIDAFSPESSPLSGFSSLSSVAVNSIVSNAEHY